MVPNQAMICMPENKFAVLEKKNCQLALPSLAVVAFVGFRSHTLYSLSWETLLKIFQRLISDDRAMTSTGN